MRFQRIEPRTELKAFVECFWTVEGEDPTPILQKIIPDGFPEIIFHFGDPYMIKLKDQWEPQSKQLLAGQITRHFYLKNSGRSVILGIKLKPAALAHLFNIAMYEFTDRVVDLNSSVPIKFSTEISKKIDQPIDRIEGIQDQIEGLIPLNWKVGPADLAINAIFDLHGMISVSEICERANASERQLERLFKRFVGLSPKFYARIIRFNYIFQLVKVRKRSLSELGLESGFYDQSHFIKNFKAFTGEDPSQYFFDESTLANFFLKK